MTSWPLMGTRVVGAMTTWSGKAAFDRASLVLARSESPGDVLVVGSYANDEAIGSVASQIEWGALESGGQAMRFDGGPSPRPHMWLWMLRDSFPLNHEDSATDLRNEGRLTSDPRRNAGATAFVVTESRSSQVRQAWASRLYERALRSAREKRWGAAETEAGACFQVATNISVQELGLLVCVLRKCGRTVRSDGMVAMARNSWGRTFAEAVAQEADRLELSHLLQSPPEKTTVPGESLRASMREMKANRRTAAQFPPEGLGKRAA